jgi:hypothetical protein
VNDFIHVHGDALHKRHLVDAISELAVELDVSLKELVRVELQFDQSERGSDSLGVRQQISTVPFSLDRWCNGNILD